MIMDRNRGAPYESNVLDASTKPIVDTLSILCFRYVIYMRVTPTEPATRIEVVFPITAPRAPNPR